MNTNQVKRQSSFNEFLDFETKKLRKAINDNDSLSITSIEDLSNEIFFEVFDYLDGCELYEAFSNLNTRFQCLINSSSLLLKLSFDDLSELDVEHCCRHTIIPNRYRIISLQISNERRLEDFFNYCLIDESFIHLESIRLYRIPLCTLMLILFDLKSLPRLFTLGIYINNDDFHTDFSEVYQMVFRLPSLTCNYLSLPMYNEANVLLPYAINDRFSSLKKLFISHSCTLDELISILYHTPQLCYFGCGGTIHSSHNVKSKVSLILSSLTYLRIWRWDMELVEFEIFLKKISSPLQVLHINHFEGEDYIDPDQWDRFTLQYVPHLRNFSVKCLVHIDDIFTDLHFKPFIHYFNSRLRIERGWIFGLELEGTQIWYSFNSTKRKLLYFDEDVKVENVTYSNQTICHNSSQHAENISQQKNTNSSIPSSEPIELRLDGFSEAEWTVSFIDKVSPILLAIQFTSLHVSSSNLTLDNLLRIMSSLPNLDTLKFSSLIEPQLNNLSNEQADTLYSISIKNKITKVYSSLTHESTDFLLTLCPCMKYFKLAFVSAIHLENLVRLILTKRMTHVPYLNSLCFELIYEGNGVVEKLQQVIDSEKLLSNYTLKHFVEKISLKWNLQ